jgi:hypothetical protein
MMVTPCDIAYASIHPCIPYSTRHRQHNEEGSATMETDMSTPLHARANEVEIVLGAAGVSQGCVAHLQPLQILFKLASSLGSRLQQRNGLSRRMCLLPRRCAETILLYRRQSVDDNRSLDHRAG